MAAQNKPNFALCKARKFSTSSLVTFSILTNKINDTYVFRARIMQSIRDARLISKTKSQNTRNGGMVE